VQNRLKESSERLVGVKQVADAAAKAWKKGFCLHPKAGTGNCDRIIDAHTIPKASTLKRLKDPTGHLLTFHSFRRAFEESEGPWKVGWKLASTFRGFCAKHDNETFAPLEKQTFNRSPEQCFLLAFRGVCYELFCKKWAEQTIRILAENLKQDPDADKQEFVRLFELGVQAGIRDLMEHKKRLDADLLARRFGGWQHVGFTLTGELSIAATGVFAPEVSFDGRGLQILEDPARLIYPLVVSMLVSGEDRFEIVLSWPVEATCCGEFVTSLVSTFSERDPPQALARFLFANVENVYFSSQWWNNLNSEEQKLIRQLALKIKPDADAIVKPGRPLVNWELVDLWAVD
jgi:hypothetical protein